MPVPRKRTSTRPASGPRTVSRASNARVAEAPQGAGNEAARVAPRPGRTADGARRVQAAAGRGAPEGPEAAALCGLLRGLRAGDLETVLLTVAMAAEENRMPSADPDEARRILRFLARLAGHDARLPPPRGGPRGGGPGSTRDGIDAGDGAPAR
jgi:hypothetical protein